MAHKSVMAEHACYFPMTETEQNTRAARELYGKLMPNEPVSKWKAFAERACKKFSRPASLLSHNQGGEKPRVSREVALKIGTVYTQRLVWEHGEPRHYRDMNKVCNMKLLAPVLAAGTRPTTPLAS